MQRITRSQTREANPTQGSTSASKTRGPTLGLKTWKRNGKPLDIEYNEWGQPIGHDSIELETYLGVLARNNELAPLDIFDWRAIPPNLKELMWSEVERNFNPGLELKEYIFKSIGKKWKDYKSRLKAAYYDPILSISERVANLPPRVNEDQWLAINVYWDSEKGKKRSMIGKDGRSKLQMNHTAGRKSFARIRAIEMKKRGGLVPSRAEIFRITHTKKNKLPVDSKSAEIMDQLSVVELDQPELSQCAASRKDSLSRVLGEDCHGHVRTFGLGPSPSNVYGSQPTRMEYKRLADDAVRSSEERVHAMEEKVLRMQKTIEDMAREMKSMMGAMKNTSSAQAFEVDLINFSAQEEVVAQGRIISKDPDKEVGGFKLGPHFWEVYVEIAIKEQEFLVRPHGHFSTIKEAVGSTIAWPSTKVIVKRDTPQLL